MITFLGILICTSCLRKIEGQNNLQIPKQEVQALQERCMQSNEESNVFVLTKELQENKKT